MSADDFKAGVRWSATIVETTRKQLAGASPGVLDTLDAVAEVLLEFAGPAAETHSRGDQQWARDSSSLH